MNLDTATVMVTGAASGMGRHFTARLLAAGARVCAVDLAPEPLAALATDLAAPPERLLTVAADISQEAAVSALVARAWDHFGPVTVLVNNAGITRDQLLLRRDRATGQVLTHSLEDWRRVLEVNLTGPFLCAREVACRLVAAEQRGGVIVNLSSISRAGNAGQSAYSAAKAALAADTVVWARELARYGLRVAAIAPGFIDTPLVAKMRPEHLERTTAAIPLGRLGTPEEVWLGLRFILECDYFTGRVLELDGGLRL